MISLITISCIAAAFAPVISKRIQSDTIRAGSTAKLESNCSEQFGEDCKFCGDKCCYICDSDAKCKEDEYKSTCKCACVKCNATKSDAGYGEGCVECDGSGCTKCQDGDNGYYLKEDKTCAKCTQAGKTYSDGKNCVASCESTLTTGYFCKNIGGKKVKTACTAQYSSNCSACTDKKCTSCGWAQHADSKGNCVGCGITQCSTCKNCDGYDTCTKCQGCMEGVLINNATACKKCYLITTNCYYCDPSTAVCTACNNGYYLTNNKQCQQCTISNCMQCQGGRAANSPMCERCRPGYYINGSNCTLCTSKYGSNCAACNASQCLACVSGYNLNESKTCVSNEGVWKCNDANFMKIGKLCITRYNMGDISLLSIPSSVHIAKAGSGEFCYASAGELCCWSNVGNCNGDGVYKGCRTRCTNGAAVEICKKFNYAGLKWRLPTYNEVSTFITNGYVGDSGLQFCQEGGSVLTKCDRPYACSGSYTGISGDCWTQDVATQEKDGRCGNCGLSSLSQLTGGTGSVSGCNTSRVPFHVRCVAEMDE